MPDVPATSLRALGVDPGEKRIGLAISDSDGLVATPLSTLATRPGESSAKRIVDVAADYGARWIVIGLPLTMSGEEGEAATRARELAGLVEGAVRGVVPGNGAPGNGTPEPAEGQLSRRPAGRADELAAGSGIPGLPAGTAPEEPEARAHIQVVLQDERLSSSEAESALRSAGVASTRSRSVVDQAAATFILQRWLDGARNRLGRESQ